VDVLLVVNDTASSVTPARREEVRRRLAERHDVRVADTTHRGHATELARAAAADGVGCVALLGGDGTLNEAANGLVGSDCTLAPLPGGSTNVFARSIGLPNDPVRAAERVSLLLEHDRTERIPVGEVSATGPARAFLCHVGVGWDAVLVANVERRGHLKRHATVPLYAWAGIEAFFSGYDRRHPHLEVTIAGRTVTDAYFALVMNSDPYTFAGSRPFRVVPRTDLRSGLGVATLTSLSLPVFLRAAAQALGRGVRPGRHVWIDDDVTELEVAALDGPVPYQVDGDHLGEVDRLRFRSRPDALSIVALPR
jgi:diacylglycerol kinase family enzyme